MVGVDWGSAGLSTTVSGTGVSTTAPATVVSPARQPVKWLCGDGNPRSRLEAALEVRCIRPSHNTLLMTRLPGRDFSP